MSVSFPADTRILCTGVNYSRKYIKLNGYTKNYGTMATTRHISTPSHPPPKFGEFIVLVTGIWGFEAATPIWEEYLLFLESNGILRQISDIFGGQFWSGQPTN